MGIASLGREVVDRPLKLFYGCLILINVVAPLGLLFAVRSGRAEFFGLIAVLTMGTVVADALVLHSKRGQTLSINPLDNRGLGSAERILGDLRVPVSMLLLAVFVLTVVGRGGALYLAMAGFFFLMIMRIYFTDYRTEPVGVDLVLLMLGGGLLIASQTLTVAYYAETRDTLYHSAVASRIANYGLDSIAGARYEGLTAYHVIVATGLGMADISARLFAAVLFVVVFPVVIPLALEVAHEFRFGSTLGLLAGVAVAVNPAFVRWGSQAHPQSLSFLFLAFFILLLARETHNRRFLALSVLLSGVWVMTHHLSLFMSLALVGVPLGVLGVQKAKALIQRKFDSSFGPTVAPGGAKYVVLVACTLLYWEEIGVIQESRDWVFEYSPAASAGVETTAKLIVTYDDPATLVRESIPTLLSNLHYGLWIGFAALGIWSLFKSTRVKTRHVPMALLALIAAGVFYFPNPAWIPLRGVAFLDRWGIMTLPFIAGAVALALDRLRRTAVGRGRVLLPVLLLFVLLTVSVSAGFSDPSTSDIAGFEKGERKYLSSDDMAAVSYTTTYSNQEDDVISGGVLNNYFILQEWIRRPGDTQPIGEWNDRFNRIEVADGVVTSQDGLTVFQRAAFEEKGIRMAILNPDYEVYEDVEGITILSPVSNEYASWRDDSKNVVYANGETVITYQDDDE